MKYHIFFLLAILFTSISLSQDFGIKIGATRSEIIVTDKKNPPYGPIENDLGPAFNPSICIFTNVITSQLLDIKANLNYIQIGSSKTQNMSYLSWNDDPSLPPKHADYTSVVDMQYLQLSISFQPKLYLGNTIVYLSIDPSVSYVTKISNLLLTEGKTSFIFGAAGGVGVNIATVAGKNIFGEVKYYRDLTSFYKTPYEKFWNSYFIITFGTTL
jgi:hypothetical protein